MLIGRKKGLEHLESVYQQTGFQMAVIYGKKRIGKTVLLNEFIKNKNSLFLCADAVNVSLNLSKFTKVINRKSGKPALPILDSWENLFKEIAQLYRRERLILVMDEYENIANSSKDFNQILKKMIETHLKQTNIFLILCSSLPIFIENSVLIDGNPFFKDIACQLKMEQLNYFDTSMFYEDFSSFDKVRTYAVFGGSPFYMPLIKQDISFEENLRALFFTKSGPLFDEGTLLISQDFRETSNYNAILLAIAMGCTTLSDIVRFTKQETSVTSKYMVVLQEMKIIERIIPFGADPKVGKTSQYRIVDNLLCFWFRFVFTNRSEIVRGNGDACLNDALLALDDFMRPIFHKICSQYLWLLNERNELPFALGSLGCWWGQDRSGQAHYVDMIAQSTNKKTIMLGQCLWNELPKAVYEPAIVKTASLNKKNLLHWVFTNGHQPDTADHIITLDDLYFVNDEQVHNQASQTLSVHLL